MQVHVPVIEGQGNKAILQAGCSAVVQAFHQLRSVMEESSLDGISKRYMQGGVVGKSVPRYVLSLIKLCRITEFK